MAWRMLGQNKHLQEFRFQYCGSSSSSSGLRSFVKNNYTAMKTANPRLPLLVRECKGIEPRVVARYGFGIEKSSNVGSFDETAILSIVTQMGELQPSKS